MRAFDELTIAIDPPRADGSFPVRLQTSDGKRYRASLVLPTDDLDYQRLLQQIQDDDEAQPLSETDVMTFGALLTRYFLVGDIKTAFEAARHLAAYARRKLRIRLVMESDAPFASVAAVPWEFMATDVGIPLVMRYSLCRSLPREDPVPTLEVSSGEPIRLLIAWADRDRSQPTMETDIDALVSSLRPLVDTGRVIIKVIAHCTGPLLDEGIDDYHPHIIHLMTLTGRDGENHQLILETSQGAPHLITGRWLGIFLGDRDIHLVVCHAPRSGAIGSVILRGIAPALLGANLPAVIALQADLQRDIGMIANTVFYTRLIETGSLDLALHSARRAILAHGRNHTDWGSLTLYMRASDGLLMRSPSAPPDASGVPPDTTGVTPVFARGPAVGSPSPIAAPPSTAAPAPISDPWLMLASIPHDHLPEPQPILPPGSRMTLQRNPQFVGRDNALRTMALSLADPRPTIITPVILSGMGGIGKTSLVIEFVYRYGRYFAGGIFWVNCANPNTVPNELVACAIALAPQRVGDLPAVQIAAVQHVWQEAIPRLLIFDNCEDPEILRTWMPIVGGCRVVVTTRHGGWPTAWPVSVGGLVRTESIDLLRQIAPYLTVAEASGIADVVDDVPLALHLAGSYLVRVEGRETPQQYLERLAAVDVLDDPTFTGRALPAGELLPTHHEQNIMRTFAISFEQLTITDPIDALAHHVLGCLTCLAPGVPVPDDLMEHMLPKGTRLLDSIDAVDRTVALGLVEREADHSIRVHRLIYRYLGRVIAKESIRPLVEQALGAYTTALALPIDPHHIGHVLPHLSWCTKDMTTRTDPVMTQLTNLLARFLMAQGHQAASFGHEHLDIATRLLELAEKLEAQNRWAEAEPLYQQAFAIRQSVLGEEHSDTRAVSDRLKRYKTLRETQGNPGMPTEE